LKSTNQLAKRQGVEQGRLAQFEPAFQAEAAVQSFFIGRNVQTANGSYTIQGPAHAFTNADDAGVDALALAYAVTAAIGDNRERAGYIVSMGSGYGYASPYELGRGNVVSRPFFVGETASAAFDNPSESVTDVGMFHIHLNAHGLDYHTNKGFGPDDLYASQQLAKRNSNDPNSGKLFSHYLGASDGAIRVLRDPWSQPIQSHPGTIPPITALNVIKPAGFFNLGSPN